MYERFNDNFQTIMPPQTPDITPYQQPYGMNQNYLQPNSLPSSQLFPSPSSFPSSSLATQPLPGLMPQDGPYSQNNYYAKGGHVSRNMYPSLAEMIRRQGEGEDQILAHINPAEAEMLAKYSGGDINPTTGLPQFGLFRNPLKWLKGTIGGAGGAILGNILMPGVGGIIGGALGGAAGSAMRGRKDFLQSALRGAGVGAALPTLAGLGGTLASSLGAPGLGSTLTNYGNANAIIPSLGKLIGNNSVGNYVGSIGQRNTVGSALQGNAMATPAAEKGFLGMLTDKSKSFFTDPANLLTTGVLASSFFNRPKEKSPEKLAEEQKRYQQALLLSPEERARKEAHDLAEIQSLRRIERNKFLPEERLNIEPIYRRTNKPEEFKRTGRWFDYYNNPDFSGSSLPNYMKGGSVSNENINIPTGLSGYMRGGTGGQDDRRRVQLPEGAYVVNASDVADIGDGNSEAGARKLDAYISDGEYIIAPDKVTNKFGNGNNEKGALKLDQMMRNIRLHKRTGGKFPPKAKSLANYMK